MYGIDLKCHFVLSLPFVRLADMQQKGAQSSNCLTGHSVRNGGSRRCVMYILLPLMMAYTAAHSLAIALRDGNYRPATRCVVWKGVLHQISRVSGEKHAGWHVDRTYGAV